MSNFPLFFHCMPLKKNFSVSHVSCFRSASSVIESNCIQLSSFSIKLCFPLLFSVYSLFQQFSGIRHQLFLSHFYFLFGLITCEPNPPLHHFHFVILCLTGCYKSRSLGLICPFFHCLKQGGGKDRNI